MFIVYCTTLDLLSMEDQDLLEEEYCDDSTVEEISSSGTENDDTAQSGETKKHRTQTWLSGMIPHLSLPIPSVPPMMTKNPFAMLHNERNKTRAETKKVFRAKSRRRASCVDNRLGLVRTASAYPEAIDGKSRPNEVLQAVKYSFLMISVPRFLPAPREPDPFDCLNGQDVVILGGYRGSILRDVKARKRVWVPLVKAGLNIRKADLSIPLEDGAEECTEETIIPDGILSKIGPIDFCSHLIDKLKTLQRHGKCRLHIFGYDWRVSLHIASRKLQEFLERLPSNIHSKQGALVIAHSMGGLVAHHAMQMRPELFQGTVYAGTPFEHCVGILGPLKRGDSLLANREILSAEVNFSMRSSFVFLPFSGQCFYDRRTREKYLMDFFNYNTWLEWGLSPCVSDVGEKPKTASFSAEPYSETSSTLSKDIEPINSRSRSFETRSFNADAAKFLETHLFSVFENVPKAATKPKFDRADAITYLQRTLAGAKQFKNELEFDPSKEYPPLAVVYSNTTATVRGALVDGPEDIRAGNWWDFTYGPGDGVVLAKSAQLPEGFSRCVKVRSQRGHIQLLDDLKAVGTAIEGVILAREAGFHEGA
jgi:Lecithin:cholesterol acyltransferase